VPTLLVFSNADAKWNCRPENKAVFMSTFITKLECYVLQILIAVILFKIGLKLDKISLKDIIRHWLKLDNSTIPHFAITFDSVRSMKNSLYFQPSQIKSITMSAALQSHKCQVKGFTICKKTTIGCKSR